MHKSLVYFYEIKKNDISKANGSVGIIPYCYQDSYNYYYSLWLAKQRNENKEIKDYIPQERIITIPVPRRKTRQRKIFTFLDEEVQGDE